MTRIALVLGVASLIGAGCGASSGSRLEPTRAVLAATLSPEGSSDAELAARGALAEAEQSEARGDALAADEHATRARAWAEVATMERDASALEDALAQLRVELAQRTHEAGTLEEATRRASRENTELADRGAALVELRRALALAEQDEARPRRARRVGLAEGPDVQRLARVLADRARVLFYAAQAMGAPIEALARATTALDAVDRAASPGDRLAAADAARASALAALAEARRRAGEAPSPEEARSLVEALEAEGYPILRDEAGIAVRLADVFSGQTISSAARGRLRHLGELLGSHPFGPIAVLFFGADDRAARAAHQRRFEALLAALGAGSRATTLTIVPAPPGDDTANEVRVFLPAYAELATASAAPR